jgi:formylglycine-generating enzyme required for sulfatase activity
MGVLPASLRIVSSLPARLRRTSLWSLALLLFSGFLPGPSERSAVGQNPSPDSPVSAANAVSARPDDSTGQSLPAATDLPSTTEASASPEAALERFVRECVEIRPGTSTFPRRAILGSDHPDDPGLPKQEVTFDQVFRISRYETTQELYDAVIGANPSRWKGPRNSAEMMSWKDAREFCRKLTLVLRQRSLIRDNESVRLPTEAEWEYCCRAGTVTRYSFGEAAARATDVSPRASMLDEYAWHTGNAAGNDPAVGILKPNPWGLYDMHGYLSEYVQDSWSTPGSDTDSATGGTQRVIRGGSWKDHYSELTSASRMPVSEEGTSDGIGFRCVIAENPENDR